MNKMNLYFAGKLTQRGVIVFGGAEDRHIADAKARGFFVLLCDGYAEMWS